MTPQQIRELIAQLADFYQWLESEEPTTLSCYAVSDCMAVLKVELLALVKDGAS